MSENQALMKARPAIDFAGLPILGIAYRKLSEQSEMLERIEQDQLAAVNEAMKLGQLLGHDMTTADGSSHALKAVLSLANLGLERASKENEIEAVNLLRKNPMAKFYAIGQALVREQTVEADRLWQNSVVKLPNKEEYYGLLPLALEEQLNSVRRFKPCAEVEELNRRHDLLARCQNFLDLSKSMPIGPFLGERVIIKAFDFARFKFQRLSRDEPSKSGGILMPLVGTLMIKVVLHTYRRRTLRPPEDREGYRNWSVTTREIKDFTAGVFGNPDFLVGRLPKIKELLSIYFTNEATDLSARHMSRKRFLEQLPFLSELFEELVGKVQEFYSKIGASDVTDEHLDAFWLDKLVIDDRRRGEKLHARNVPSLASVLRQSVIELPALLAGFAEWPAKLRQDFVSRYPFTREVRMSASGQRRKGGELGELVRLIHGSSPSDGETAFGRVDFKQLSIPTIYGLYLAGDEWIRLGVLARIREMRVGAHGLRTIFNGEFVPNDHSDSRFLSAFLLATMAVERMTVKDWIKAISGVSQSASFPPYFRSCPEAIRKEVMAGVPESLRHNSLSGLSESELRAIIVNVGGIAEAKIPSDISRVHLVTLACDSYSRCSSR